jgi:formamidopyrimidine-DNA glycosylase
MPELPEVELVCRALAKVLRGRSIVAAKVTLPRIVRPDHPTKFARRLRQVPVGPIARRAKHILIPVGETDVLVAHLGMTGRFVLLSPDDKLPPHSHAIFYLDNERRLVFSDPRQFGHLGLVRANKISDYPPLKGLGPEPLSSEFGAEYLRGAFATTRRALKEVLLDQRKVAGLGNIYAAEAMFIAGINPFIPADSLGRKRLERLQAAVKLILNESISHGSTMNGDPEAVESAYFYGGFNGRWRVYDREGFPCPKCGTKIRRVFQAGRSTYYCPRCQKR